MMVVTSSPYAKIFQKSFIVEKKVPVTKEEQVEEVIVGDDGKERVQTRTVRRKTVEVVSERVTQADLLANPERIFVDEQFTVVVEKSSGDVAFTSGIPRYIPDPDLQQFLTGGAGGDLKQETDFSGVVLVPLKLDQIGAVVGMVTGSADADDIREGISRGLQEARALSDARVLRQVRTVYNRYKGQIKVNKENNLGDYQPSPEEFLCAYVLAAEETKLSDDRKKITAQFKSLMDSVSL